VALKQHFGLIILMRWKRMNPTLCRACGIAMFRKVQADTLLTGWWGLASLLIMNWVAIFTNLGTRAKLVRLAPPQRDPAFTGRVPDPLPLGAPLWRRPQAYVGLAVVSAVAIVVLASHFSTSDSPSPIGNVDQGLVDQCVRINGEQLSGTIDCSKAHDGVVDAVRYDLGSGVTCPNAADAQFGDTSSSTSPTICVDLTQSKH
jgi:hypothetical protein